MENPEHADVMLFVEGLDWLRDCFGTNDPTLDMVTVHDREVIRAGIERVYEGGWRAFRAGERAAGLNQGGTSSLPDGRGNDGR